MGFTMVSNINALHDFEERDDYNRKINNSLDYYDTDLFFRKRMKDLMFDFSLKHRIALVDFTDQDSQEYFHHSSSTTNLSGSGVSYQYQGKNYYLGCGAKIYYNLSVEKSRSNIYWLTQLSFHKMYHSDLDQNKKRTFRYVYHESDEPGESFNYSYSLTEPASDYLAIGSDKILSEVGLGFLANIYLSNRLNLDLTMACRTYLNSNMTTEMATSRVNFMLGLGLDWKFKNN